MQEIIQSACERSAAEYKALTYQSYSLAKQRIEQILANPRFHKNNPAIVTDIDETVLDNSPFNAKLIELDVSYNRDLWLEWANLVQADPIPGALEFFTYAAGKGIEIFYISNRLAEQQQATIKNLQKFGFPFADTAHVLLKTVTSGKELRRKKIAETYEIILLLGDNLSDFSSVFDNQGTARRNALVDSLKEDFGDRFIVFPNPMYGDWESKGIYEGRYDWSYQQLDSLRHANLKLY
jgi:5'-nucleotidase (lipoprotein e(P4) family)